MLSTGYARACRLVAVAGGCGWRLVAGGWWRWLRLAAVAVAGGWGAVAVSGAVAVAGGGAAGWAGAWWLVAVVGGWWLWPVAGGCGWWLWLVALAGCWWQWLLPVAGNSGWLLWVWLLPGGCGRGCGQWGLVAVAGDLLAAGCGWLLVAVAGDRLVALVVACWLWLWRVSSVVPRGSCW